MRRDLVLYALLFALGMTAIILAPGPATVGLIVLIPALAAGAAVGVVYLVRIYFRLQPPRPRFFRMVVVTQAQKLLLAVPLAYLAVAFLLTGLGVHLPTVSGRVAGGFTVLVLCLLLTPPIQYALEVWQARRLHDGDAEDAHSP